MVKTYNGETYIIPEKFEEEVRAYERLKTIDECMSKCVTVLNECLADVLTPYVIKRVEHDLQKVVMELKEQK